MVIKDFVEATCVGCSVIAILSDDFLCVTCWDGPPDPVNRSSLTRSERRREYQRSYYKSHRGGIQVRHGAYRKQNSEDIRLYQHAYYKENRTEIKKRRDLHYQANYESILARRRLRRPSRAKPIGGPF